LDDPVGVEWGNRVIESSSLWFEKGNIKCEVNADSYILISAGKDGDFGTADDILNFDKEITE